MSRAIEEELDFMEAKKKLLLEKVVLAIMMVHKNNFYIVANTQISYLVVRSGVGRGQLGLPVIVAEVCRLRQELLSALNEEVRLITAVHLRGDRESSK